ncbi:hypothetical protein D3C81_1313700 [compost metagenome]
MNATVFTLLLPMCSAIAVAMCESFCGVLKIQARLASIGSMMRAEAAMVIIGVSFSATTSTMASEFGVTVEPTTTSTLSSLISLRVFLTAVVVSEASSRTMYSIFLPATSFGISVKVFFSGIPSDAAGPVADTVTPTLTWAWAAPAARQAAAIASRLARLKSILSPSVPETERHPSGVHRRMPIFFADPSGLRRHIAGTCATARNDVTPFPISRPRREPARPGEPAHFPRNRRFCHSPTVRSGMRIESITAT